jgi:hypothetical protein
LNSPLPLLLHTKGYHIPDQKKLIISHAHHTAQTPPTNSMTLRMTNVCFKDFNALQNIFMAFSTVIIVIQTSGASYKMSVFVGKYLFCHITGLKLSLVSLKIWDFFSIIATAVALAVAAASAVQGWLP